MLLHDRSQPENEEHAKQCLKQMQQTFGVGVCGMVTINSVPLEQPDGGHSILWAKPAVSSTPVGAEGDGYKGETGVYGMFLSPEDLASVENLSRHFIKDALVPFLERKVQHLVEAINTQRGGIKNVVKNWWKSKPDAPAGQPFKVGSPEFQMRQLADLAFVMRDFELALKRCLDPLTLTLTPVTLHEPLPHQP